MEELRRSVRLIKPKFNRQIQGDFVTQNSTLNFAARTFRIVVQRDFIIELSVILTFLIVGLNYRRIYVKFCFLIGGTAMQTQEMLKKHFAYITKGRTQNSK
jgi:hypothetical protein